MRRRSSRVLSILAGVVTFVALNAAPEPVSAQTPYVPYFGKNQVRYDRFDWHIYKTDHFDIFYYPELEKHLERVASYAESAYQRVSAELKHDLADRVPLILFKTQSEFQEQHVSGELPEGVLAFAEPERNRMVLPIDEPPDQLYRLITHELTHIFEFDIIPRGIIGEGLPLWVDEGLSDYMAGYWNVLDLMAVRDAALTDNVPRMSNFQTAALSGRTPYSLGHATFEFIEAKWGKEGLRQFLFSLRKSVLGGGESAYEEALKVKPEEFDELFERYLKDRFKAFRDKERPNDYGRDLTPNPERTPYVSVLTLDPSPSGDMVAAVIGNRRDYELDIVLLSTRDGEVIRNLTKGLDKDRGFEYIATSGGLRGNLVPWITWAPVGDHIGYFARTEKEKSLIIQNVVTGKQDRRVDLKAVDSPESPAFSPDGRRVAFAALKDGISDIYIVDIQNGDLMNMTKDNTADYAPTFSPDGKMLVYTARIGGNDKLYQLDIATGAKKQLTFGSHEDTAAKFYDDHTVVFTSTAVDPAINMPDEISRNANIPNVWSLDLLTNELKQWTDTATGIVSPVVLRQPNGLRIAFVTYYKGQNGLHVIAPDKPIATVASEDFGSPGPVFDFTAPLSHTLLRDNIHKKGKFERMTLAGRPPVNLGVTSSGNFYGNTQIDFTDVLGDKSISFYAQSISQYRTMAFTYVNNERRLQYALQGFSQDQFYYGQDVTGALYDPALAPYITYDLAEASSSQWGGNVFAIYPLNRYTRLEGYTGYVHMSENYTNPALQQLADEYQQAQFGQSQFRNGNMLPFGVALVKETTVFREFGPVAGSTMKLSYDTSPPLGGSWISRQTLNFDGRFYKRLVANGVFAVRFKGMKSWGANPDYMYFGGNSEMRGYEYLQFLGQRAFFTNAELRFPLIEAMLTPIGVLGGLRGVLFANIGGGAYNGVPYSFSKMGSEIYTPIIGYQQVDAIGTLEPVYGPPISVSGFRLVDGRGSYGMGLETMMLGFPMHFDWAWKTLFNRDWEDAYFAAYGGSNAFRKVKFNFWIGYNF
jgi:WD40 repeat protein